MICLDKLPIEIVNIIQEFTLYHCRSCFKPLNYWIEGGPPITNKYATCKKCYDKDKKEKLLKMPYCIIPTFYSDIDSIFHSYDCYIKSKCNCKKCYFSNFANIILNSSS